MSDYPFGWGRLPKEMSPSDLQRLTNVAIEPVQNLKTGATQAAENAKEKTTKFIGTILKMAPPPAKMIKSGHWPTFLTPWLMEEMERQEQEKKPEMLTKSE